MYRFVEKPFRGSQAPVTLAGFGKLTAACVALSLLLVVPAAFADRQKGWSWRLTDAQREVRDKHRYGGAVCVEDGASQCAFGDLRSPLGVFLVGDSYMEHLIPAFISVAQQFQMRGEVLALGGCTMLLGLQAVLPNGDISSTCRRFRDQTIGKLRSNDIPVVISLRWKTTALADDDGNSLEGQPANIRIEAWRQAIERTIATLGLNRKYLLIGSQVQFSCIVGREQFYIGPMSSGGVDGICNDLPAATARSENAAVNGMLRAVQKAHPEQVTLLFPEDYICSESRCIFEWNGRLLYHDSSHFTVAGAEYIGARADKELQNFFLSAAPAAKRPGQ